MNNLSIIVTDQRAPFITNLLNKGTFTVSPYSDYFVTIEFKEIDQLTLLALFHAGIDCGKNIFAPLLSA